MNGNDETLQPMSISEICEVYRLKQTTLNEWISLGVCEKVQYRFNNRGRTMSVLMPDQIRRLERFLRYREWFIRKHNNDRPQVTEVIGLLEAIDEGDLKGAIAILIDIEQTLGDKLSDIQLEIQSLHARLYHDERINPEEVD